MDTTTTVQMSNNDVHKELLKVRFVYMRLTAFKGGPLSLIQSGKIPSLTESELLEFAKSINMSAQEVTAKINFLSNPNNQKFLPYIDGFGASYELFLRDYYEWRRQNPDVAESEMIPLFLERVYQFQEEQSRRDAQQHALLQKEETKDTNNDVSSDHDALQNGVLQNEETGDTIEDVSSDQHAQLCLPKEETQDTKKDVSSDHDALQIGLLQNEETQDTNQDVSLDHDAIQIDLLQKEETQDTKKDVSSDHDALQIHLLQKEETQDTNQDVTTGHDVLQIDLLQKEKMEKQDTIKEVSSEKDDPQLELLQNEVTNLILKSKTSLVYRCKLCGGVFTNLLLLVDHKKSECN